MKWLPGACGEGAWEVTANGYGFVFFLNDKTVMELGSRIDWITLQNIQDTMELYTLKRWSLWYMNCISKKNYKKKIVGGWLEPFFTFFSIT